MSELIEDDYGIGDVVSVAVGSFVKKSGLGTLTRVRRVKVLKMFLHGL
jgi:hypothetical protein